LNRRDVLLAGSAASLALQANTPGFAGAQDSIYDYSLMMKGEPVSLKKYEGQVLVILNIASE